MVSEVDAVLVPLCFYGLYLCYSRVLCSEQPQVLLLKEAPFLLRYSYQPLSNLERVSVFDFFMEGSKEKKITGMPQ